jgi:tRNA dimethylallyltransferase
VTGPEVPVPFLVGATGVGKSDVAIEIARRVGAEVIACDALTVYRRIRVLTAKPVAPPDVPHHVLDVVEPWESYSAARFVEDADRLVAEIRSRGRIPLVVGGTALYAKSFIQGLGAGAGRDTALRAEFESLVARDSPEALPSRLATKDPARAAQLHAHDTRRVIRALEIVEATGRPASELRSEWTSPPRRAAVVVGLRRGAEDLAARIEARARAMLAAGVAAEVAALDAGPRPPSPELSQALGLADVREFRAGTLSADALVERLARATRRFAKRQRTFFRQLDATWIDVGTEQPTVEIAQAAIEHWQRGGAIPRS